MTAPNLLTWWGRYKWSVYPIGETSVFSFQTDGVTPGDTSCIISTYWEWNTPSFPYRIDEAYGNYTDFTTAIVVPTGVNTPIPSAILLLGSGIVGLTFLKKKSKNCPR
jgi:hypothetical protein